MIFRKNITFRLIFCCCLLVSMQPLFGQCVDNSNYWVESWVSCSTDPSPNTARGNGHWLLYEFNEPQAISTTTIWNANRIGESGLGAKEVYIDISTDGANWISINPTPFTWSKGTEALDYPGFDGPNLESYGFIKKILFTVVSNFDNSACYSIAEVKFDINPLACYGVEDECGICDGPGMPTWYADNDGDGLGNYRDTLVDCNQPIGYVENSDDPCDSGLLGWMDMQVLFEENGCTGCHGNQGAGGLDLTSYEAFSQGGNNCGTNILTGNTLVSIIEIDNYAGCSAPISFPSMNDRAGGTIDASEIAMIQMWIDGGAIEDCNCPPGSPDTDNDGVCDAIDDCPNFDNNLIGTPCDDGLACTTNDTYMASCNCEGMLVADSDFDGVCDSLDIAPLNPCTADGVLGMPEPMDWLASESNDCDQDGIFVEDNDMDDFDACIDDQGVSLSPACNCPNEAIQSGGKYVASYGVWGTSAYYAEGLPDGNLSGGIGWEDYVELSYPYMEIGQEICFDLGFDNPQGAVQFEVNELGTYKYYNADTTQVNYEIQQYCFPVFVAGEQLVRITRYITGNVRIDGSFINHCPCEISDPKFNHIACQCPTTFSSGEGALILSGGFNSPENAEGLPDGNITGYIGGSGDSLIYTYPNLPVNSEICLAVSFDNIAGKISLDLNGEHFQRTNPSGSLDKFDVQEICFLTSTAGTQTLKIKDDGSGSFWMDGTYYKSCNNCLADTDDDTVCDDEDVCPGFNDLADVDADGIPDGCDNCDNNLVNTPCDDSDPCTINDTYDANCNCVGTFNDTNNDGVCDPIEFSPFIHVDQFGYYTDAEKVAVLSNPQVGFNSNESYTPSGTIELRQTSDDAVVFSGAPTPWNGGATQVESGDQGWWFDFSAYQTEGEYYVIDAQNGHRTGNFFISCNPYDNVLTAASKMFYYNRCNIEKSATYAGTKWADGNSFMGNTQDGNARYVYDQNNVALERDLSGGWFDAGDYNKYVTFAYRPVDQLLWAYTNNPQAFGDNTNIPESGNGIPDILDEVKWELDWLLKMTNPDGTTIQKMGNIDYGTNDQSPPSINTGTRYYGPTCSSASAAVAANFSHAAVVLRKLPGFQQYALDMQENAEAAFNFILPKINAGTLEINCDDQTIKSGDADWDEADQIEAAVVAAIYLFELTNDPVYDNFISARATTVEPLSTGWWGPYKMPIVDALLHYTTLPNANTSFATTVLNSFNGTTGDPMYGFSDSDLYRAYIPEWAYHWGSNQIKANIANLNSNVIDYNINASNHANYQNKLSDQVHYFHGVNPLDLVYLTNMNSLGAENSVNEMYHNWFADGTIYDNALNSPSGPPPGYVSGGANSSFSVLNIAPPAGQPQQKSYLDFNSGWPDNSWEVSEPAIYYQAAYVRMLSNSMGKEEATCEPCPTVGQSCSDGFDCTINDTYDENCNCVGEFEDTDYDGVCDAEDQCPGEDDLIDQNDNGIPDACECNLTGTSCDDLDPCTTNDAYDINCNCVGASSDTDNDGICDANDICPGGDDTIDTDNDGTPDACDNCSTAGQPCDDNDPCTINDAYDINCNCVGASSDTDNDGICDANDICPGGDDTIDTDNDGIPDFCDPANCVFGTPCDDNDSCTTNDFLDIECNCVGSFTDTDNDGVCDAEDICQGGDDSIDSDNDGIPDFCDITNCIVGSSCSDNDPCTINDVFDINCECIGIFEDADNDGVCDLNDLCPGGDDEMDIDNDGTPDFCDECDGSLIGMSCDDGDLCTIDDVYDVNCNCVGVFADEDNDLICDAEDICAGGNDNEDDDNDGIPNFCDECETQINTFGSSTLEHQGAASSVLSMHMENSSNISFTISDIESQLTDMADKYIEEIQITYIDGEGELHHFANYSGADKNLIEIYIAGIVKRINIVLLDGYDGFAPNMSISISEVTSCIDTPNFNSEPPVEDDPIEIYPNPSDKEFFVKFNADIDQVYDLKIIDAWSEVLFSKEFEQIEGETIIGITSEQLPAGVYFVSLYSNKRKLKTEKLVIVKY